ncbi:hypothetical protein KNP414_03655 [Paenibacillus mucilaginosus KNP414]|uniref:Uncharacterized protein n=2 Tax=Paenibacillus mucilaginosus TaxID=61624 RepID=F8FFH1_PAEMK|nr:hypothetical protein KNP414_03655 [Paenibacillus mucilaginosus KNP414]
MLSGADNANMKSIVCSNQIECGVVNLTNPAAAMLKSNSSAEYAKGQE